MSLPGSRFTFLLLTGALCASTLNAYADGKHKHSKPAKQEQSAPTPAPVVEAPLPAALTLEQMPAVAPKVTYKDRQLTIEAQNSTLGDILRAVKAQTGASIDLPPNANSRVVAHIGPGPSRDVLASLLNGTLFNYVLLGTVNDPSAVGKIILSQKPVGGEIQSSAVQPPQQPNFPVANMNPDDQDSDAEVEVDQPMEQPETQPAEPGNAQQQNINGQQPLRTPEQLLQELQRQQLLQQQLQQQQQQGTQQPNQVPQQNPDE